MRRWIKRIAFGLIATVALAIVGVIVFVNTDYGREKVRVQLDKQLLDLFEGGGSVGKLEGSPFGELVLRDVVINGPDKRPAIKIGTLRLRIILLDLFKHDVKLREVIAEDVDVTLDRDAHGQLNITGLMKKADETDPAKVPAQPAAPSKWTVDLDNIQLRRAHVSLDSGNPDLKVINLDGAKLDGQFQLKANGDKNGKIALSGTWRERAVPVVVATELHDSVAMLALPTLTVQVGGVSILGQHLELAPRVDRTPMIGGALQIVAPAAAVNALYPPANLPEDVALQLSATRGSLSAVSIAGTFGTTPLSGHLVADLDRLHVTGTLDVGELDLAKLTHGRLQLVGAAAVAFDAMPGAAGHLPTATARITGHGTYQQVPRAEIVASVQTAGDRVTTQVDVTGPATAKLTADLDKLGDAITVRSATLVAAITDAVKASGGLSPVRGRLDVDLRASGTVTPEPNLAVSGTINGGQLAMQDLRVGSMKLVVDATHLPGHPQGSANVTLTDIAKGEQLFGLLTVKAATRDDGRLAVDVQSKPRQEPWVVELGAVVTLPDARGTTIVDLTRHHVRAGNNVDWFGTTGHVTIARDTIEVRDLHSASPEGKLAVNGRFGRQSGDLAAKVDVEAFALAVLRPGLLGVLGAHADVSRTGGRWAGSVDLTGTGLGMYLDKPLVDVVAKVQAAPGKVTLDATATNPQIGGVKLAVDLDAPARLEDAAAWEAKGQSAVRSAQLVFQKIDLGKIAAVANQQAAGTLDGELDITPTTIGGAIHIRKLQSPEMRGIKFVDADLVLAQNAPGELDPTLTVAVAEIGKVVAKAQLQLPRQLLDPAAWRRLGPDAIKSAVVTTDKVKLDPAFFDRLGMESNFRGLASLQLSVGPGLKSAKLTGGLEQVHGTPIATPVDVKLSASFDGKAATAQVAVATTGAKAMSLMKIDASIPLTLAKVFAPGFAVAALPLKATVELPKTSAAQLLNVFGRSEITEGTIDGKVEVAGTVGRPTVTAKLVADSLGIPPGPRGKPIQKVRQITVAGTWNPDKGGTISVDGLEDQGGVFKLRAQGDFRDLAAGTATIEAKNFNVTPLLVFAPGPAGGSKGTIDAKLAIKGFDVRTSKITGELHIKDARIPVAPMIGTLRQTTLDIVIHEHDIAINAKGKLGAGNVDVAGTIALDGVSLAGGKATMKLRKITPIGAVQPVVDADVTATIARKGETWNADVVVEHGFVKVQTGGEAIKPVGLPNDLVIGRGKAAARDKAAAAPSEAPILVARITLRDTKVEATEFRTTLRGQLTANVATDGVGMTGKVEALGGDLDLFGRRYKIEEAGVFFDGSIDPILGVRITHDFPDVETITEVRGRLSKPDLELSSNPGLYTKSQLLGFLLGGEPGGDPNSASARDKATDAGTSFIAGQIGGYIKSALPVSIDVIKYEAASVSSSAAITVGSWITHTLFFSFSQHIDPRVDENAGEAKIEYWFTKRLEVEGTAGDRNFDGVDLLWRKRF